MYEYNTKMGGEICDAMEPKTVPWGKNKYSKTEDTALLDLRSARGGAVTAEQNDKFWRPE